VTNFRVLLPLAVLAATLAITAAPTEALGQLHVPSDRDRRHAIQPAHSDSHIATAAGRTRGETSYVIVDTAQQRCYNNTHENEYPQGGEAFFGQDAQYRGWPPAYRDNGEGTVSDLNTGLMWQQDPGPKRTYREAVAGATQCKLAGYHDWRLPTIKELYSLILFSGTDPRAQRTGIRPVSVPLSHRSTSNSSTAAPIATSELSTRNTQRAHSTSATHECYVQLETVSATQPRQSTSTRR